MFVLSAEGDVRFSFVKYFEFFASRVYPAQVEGSDKLLDRTSENVITVTLTKQKEIKRKLRSPKIEISANFF